MANSLDKAIGKGNSNLLTKALVLLGGFLAGNYVYKNYIKNNASDSAFTDEYVTLANELYQAGHTGVGGWTEDEDRLIEIAGYIKDYAKVSQAYRAKFSRNLDDDLIEWLSTSELQQFKARLGTTVTTGTGTGGSTPTVPAQTNPNNLKVGQAVYFKESNWNVRSTIYPYKPVAKSVKGQLAGTVVQLPKVLTVQNSDGKTTKDNFVFVRTSGANFKNFYVSNSCLK